MNNVRRFPVQLLEAFLLLLLFIILQYLFFTKRKFIIGVYFFSYGIIRFVCEFLRGDLTRGYIGLLSISSWIMSSSSTSERALILHNVTDQPTVLALPANYAPTPEFSTTPVKKNKDGTLTIPPLTTAVFNGN